MKKNFFNLNFPLVLENITKISHTPPLYKYKTKLERQLFLSNAIEKFKASVNFRLIFSKLSKKMKLKKEIENFLLSRGCMYRVALMQIIMLGVYFMQTISMSNSEHLQVEHLEIGIYFCEKPINEVKKNKIFI